MDAQADVERAAKRFKEIVEVLGKNYLSAMVANGLIPVITDALLDCLGDAKKDAGLTPDTIEERLRYNENEKEPDLAMFNVDNCSIMSTRYNSSFMAYDAWAVRIGVEKREDKEAKRKPFFAMGQKHRVRYEQLRKVGDKVRKDFPDAKLPDFPAPYVFGGTFCFCCKTASGDLGAHRNAMSTYFEAINKDYPSKTVADHFKVGANWKIQQMMQEVFLQAFIATKRTVLRHSFSWELAPYDAVEALTQLLQAVADDEIIPDMVLKIPGVTPGCCRYRMIWNIRSLVFGAIDTAAQGWGPLQDAADAAGGKVGEAIKDGADALVSAVKPILQKVLNMVSEKMNDGKSAESKAMEENAEAKLGDYAVVWQFQKSGPGSKFYEALGSKTPKNAFADVAGDITNSLVAAIKNPIDALLEKILGGNLASNPFVQAAVEGLVRRTVYKIQTFTTLQGFLDAGAIIAPILDKMEEDLVAKAGGDEAAFDGVIDGASSALWKGLGNTALGLFQSIYRVESSVDRAGESDGAMEPMILFLKHMFITQMRAFNSIRVTLCNNLRGKFAGGGDAEAVRQITRTEVRNAIFEIVNILVHEMYMSGQKAMTEAAKIVVIDKFMENVWPHIAAPLAELAAELPDALKSFGLDIVALAETIIRILIGKLVGAVMQKVFMAIEQVVFNQTQ
jgi:hypothetical protein